MQSKEELIGGIPLFSELSKQELRDTVSLVDEVDVDGGRVLIEEGRTGGECFVIVEGRVEIRRDGQPIAELGAGEVLGEMALLDRKPRNASAVAMEPTRLLVLAQREFHSLLLRHPDAEAKVRAIADARRAKEG